MKNHEICIGHNSNSIRLEDFIFKAYKQEPNIPGLFPAVKLDNIPLYEQRVWSYLMESGFQVPSRLEVVSSDLLKGLLEHVDPNTDGWAHITTHLNIFPDSPCVRRSYMDAGVIGDAEEDLFFDELDRLRDIGFDMRDYEKNCGYHNFVVNSNGVGFYDFKSFFPISDEMKDAFSDLIIPEPSIEEFNRMVCSYSR